MIDISVVKTEVRAEEFYQTDVGVDQCLSDVFLLPLCTSVLDSVLDLYLADKQELELV